MDPPLPRRQSVLLVALATSLMAVSYLDRQVFAILAPTITSELHISEATYGLLAGTFSIAYLIGPPFAALLIDRVGVRRGLPLAVLFWSIVAASHSVALGVGSLFMLRFALGLAEAPSFPGAARVVHQSVSTTASPRAFGFLFTGSSIGAIIAPPLATRLASAFGWRFAFIATALVGLLWIPVWWSISSRSPAREALDRVQDREAGGFKVGDALKLSPTWRSMAAMVALSPLAAFPLLWGAKLFVSQYGVAQKDVGNLLWIPPLLYDFGAILFGDLASRLRARGNDGRALFAVGALLALCLGGLVFTRSPIAATAVIGVSMMGVGAITGIHTAELMRRVPRHLVGIAAGTVAASQSLAYIVSMALVGRVVGGSGGYDAAIVGLTLWAIPGFAIWLAWPRSAPPNLVTSEQEASSATNRID